MVQKVGTELEGTFFLKNGQLADTLKHLGGVPRATGFPFEELTTDMAASSFEMVSKPCTSGHEADLSMTRLRTLFPNDLVPVFAPRAYLGDVPLADKSRMSAMQMALDNVWMYGSRGVQKVANWNSLQFHIDTDGLNPDEQVVFMDILTMAAPESRLRFNRRLAVNGDEGHLMCWQGWSPACYVPRPYTFGTFENLRTYLAKIPKLVTLQGGEWVPANGELTAWGDPELEGVLWWLARMRAQFGTIEWRPFPSVDPVHVPQLVDDVIALARAFRVSIAKNADALCGNPIAIARIYTDLSETCWLIPRAPMSKSRWWKLYKQ